MMMMKLTVVSKISLIVRKLFLFFIRRVRVKKAEIPVRSHRNSPAPQTTQLTHFSAPFSEGNWRRFHLIKLTKLIVSEC